MRDRPKYNPALEEWIKNPTASDPPSIPYEEFKRLYGHLAPKPGQYQADEDEDSDEKGPESN